MNGRRYAAFEAIRADMRARRRRGEDEYGESNAGGGGGMLNSFPLLAIPVIVYNIIAWGGMFVGTTQDFYARLTSTVLSLPMASQVQVTLEDGSTVMERVRWDLTAGDLILMLALLLLFMELLKSTSSGKHAIVNHALSMVIFIACLIEFLLFPPFATSVFFLIMVMALLDVLAGFIVTIVTARRDVALGEGFEG